MIFKTEFEEQAFQNLQRMKEKATKILENDNRTNNNCFILNDHYSEALEILAELNTALDRKHWEQAEDCAITMVDCKPFCTNESCVKITYALLCDAGV